MRILYDLLFAQPIGSSKFHGGGEYIKTVFNHLVVNFSKKAEICTFYDRDRFLDDWLLELIYDHGIKTFDIKKVDAVPELMLRVKPDVFFSGLAYGYSEVSLPENIRRIGTIHGLRTLEKPCDQYTAVYDQNGFKNKVKDEIKWRFAQREDNYFQRKEIRRYIRVVNNFDEIVTDSNHSLYAIQTWLHSVEAERLHVFYTPAKYNDLGCDGGDALDIPSKFILLLGGNRWIKNSARTMMAIEALFEHGKLEEHSIVVCGRVPDGIRAKIRHADRYRFLDYVETDQLEQLYQSCDFFLYLSLNEGFGMPPLEAMRYGKTVITSPICSIPEICQDAVYYANPYDLKEIQNRILQACDTKIPPDKAYRQFEKIKTKQDLDLRSLCEFLLGE